MPLTAQGLTIETLDEIRTGIVNDIAGFFNISPEALGEDSFDGHLIGILSERLGLLWEMTRLVYKAMDPDAAQGQQLVQVSAITGTTPNPSVPSFVVITLTGSPSTIVPALSRAREPDTEDDFQTSIDATIVSVAAWAPNTPYSLGARRRNSNRVYQVVVAGTSAPSGGPTSDANVVQDGSVTWRFLGDGTGAVDVESTSVKRDRIIAISGAIREISTPVGGWQGVINLLDADVGAAQESDESLRLRRERELGGAGVSPIPSLRARLMRVPSVTAADVFYNVGDTVDAFGIPPHSVEALVQGGVDQDIFNTLGQNVAGGIRAFGAVNGTFVDSQGNVHNIGFTRPTTVPVWIIVNLVKNRLTYGGDIAVRDAIVALGDSMGTGRDVDPDWISAGVFMVPGILRLVRVGGIPQIFIGTAPNPTSTDPLVMSLRHQALYDTSRVTIISVDGTP